MKKGSSLFLVGVLVLIAVAFYGGYQFWQESSSEDELKKVEELLTSKKAQLLKYQNDNVGQAVAAKTILDKVKEEGVKWSKVVKEIRATVPQNTDGPIIEILAYSASSGNNISLTMQTVKGSEAPYFDVAKLIRSFDKSKYFQDTFIPSISAGTNEEGDPILSFSMSTSYVENKVVETQAPLQEDLGNALGDVLDSAAGVDGEELPGEEIPLEEIAVPVPR